MLQVLSKWISKLFGIFEGNQVVYINNKKIKVIKKIGEGGFSFVYLVKSSEYSSDAVKDSDQWKTKSSYYALKRIRIHLDEQERSFEKELHCHRLIGNQKNVICLIDGEISYKGNSVKEGLLLFPYYRNGSLQDRINKAYLDKEQIPLSETIRIFTDICNGLLVFHSQSPILAFRDLKPANVLIDGAGNAILMDLGSVSLARFKINNRSDALVLQDLCAETVTCYFRPPELFEVPSDYNFDERTDVWSLGCTLFAIAFYQSPFDGSATSATSGRIIFPRTLDVYGDRFKELILFILNPEMSKRPFVSEIIDKIKILGL